MKTKVLFAVITAMLSIVLCSCEEGYGLPPYHVNALIFAEDATVVVEYYKGEGKPNEKGVFHSDTIVFRSYDNDRIYHGHMIGTTGNRYEKHPEYHTITIKRIRGEKPVYAVRQKTVYINGEQSTFLKWDAYNNSLSQYIEHPLPILEAIAEQDPEFIEVINDDLPHVVEEPWWLGVWPEVTTE